MKIQRCDFCVSNEENGTDALRAFLQEKFPEIKLSRWGCLSNCANCYRGPFVLVNDEEIIEGETVEELKNHLLQLIEEPS